MKRKPIVTHLAQALLGCFLAGMSGSIANAQVESITFENPPYTSGVITNQDGWVFSANQNTTNMQIRTATEITNILTAQGLTPDIAVHSGNQAFLVDGADVSTTVLRVLTNSIVTNGQVSFDLWARALGPIASTGATNLGNIFVTMEDTTGNRAAAFRFGYDASTNNAHIDFASGLVGSTIWTNSGMHWTTNTWYHIAFNVDYASQTYNFFVNGTQLNAAPIPFYNNNNVSVFNRIAVVRGNLQAGMILDDFNVTSTPISNPFVRLGVNNSVYAWKFNILDFGSLTPDTNSITVTVDGLPATPTSVVQTGNIGSDGTGVTTLFFESSTPQFVLGSTHTAVVHFTGSGFSAVNTTLPFTIRPTQGALDRVHHYLGLFTGARYSTNQSGHTGAAGDYAVDMGNPPATTSRVASTDPDMLNVMRNAIANDVLSASIWVKRRTMASSSDFWINSPTAPNSGRAFQLHGPYSDDNMYFDTGGAGSATARLATNVNATLPPSFWTNGWHHIVAIKNAGDKQIWVDGNLIAEQASGAASIIGYNDLNLVVIGAASPASLVVNGLIDDFATYSTALSSNDVVALFHGTAPNSITASNSLMNWWDFNDAPDVKLTPQGNNNILVNYSQTLQVSTNVVGPYIDVAPGSNPFTNNSVTNSPLFFRAHK